ncbi:hypothetical protein HFN89_01565 [Rhizobium laguerreae]|nr:hypothetical protein [Rhizobium laguerreae]
MRVKFAHPVIVSGRNPDGSPKAELCRMESEFEVPEYTWDDAPVALVASGLSRPSEYFHIHGNKLYKAFPDGKADGHFAAGGQLFYSLHNGNARHVHFEPFYETVDREASRLEDDSGYALRVNVRRDLLKREAKARMREVTKACLNAPMLRKWNWLSPDADREIENWRSIAAEKIANIILVKGVPSLRAFEPCYVLNTTYGAPQIQIDSKHIYANQVHMVDKQDDGLEILGDDATQLGRHYFAASDYEGAVAFANTIGWRLVPSQKPDIRILKEDAVCDDFDVQETVRHARLLLTAIGTIEFQERTRKNSEVDTNLDSKVADLLSGAKTLKDEVLSWQSRRDEVDGVRRELTRLAEQAREYGSIPIVVGRSKFDALSSGLKGQLGQFVLRSDQAEVSLDIPMARGFSR